MLFCYFPDTQWAFAGWAISSNMYMWLEAITLSYVISNDVFSWIPTVMFLSFITYTHMFYRFLFFFKLKRRKEHCLMFIAVSQSLINQVFVIRSFTSLHSLVQLCFMWVVIDSGDSNKWIIASLSRLVHWKVGFQSLNEYQSGR